MCVQWREFLCRWQTKLTSLCVAVTLITFLIMFALKLLEYINIITAMIKACSDGGVINNSASRRSLARGELSDENTDTRY